VPGPEDVHDRVVAQRLGDEASRLLDAAELLRAQLLQHARDALEVGVCAHRVSLVRNS
jgi:hypothetical protein